MSSKRCCFITTFLAFLIFLFTNSYAISQEVKACNVLGGQGGRAFNGANNIGTSVFVPPLWKITRVNINWDRYIDSIQLVIAPKDDALNKNKWITLDRYGGIGGKRYAIEFAQDEFITRLCGRYGSVVDSLTIETNFGRRTTYGGSGGNRYDCIEVPAPYELVGICGRAGRYLDALGVWVR